MANNDGYANEMSNPINEPNSDEIATETTGSDATVAGLAEAFTESGDRVAAENLASRAVALQGSLGRATTNPGLLGGLTIWLGRGLAEVRTLLGRTGLRAGVGGIAAVTLMGGLAAADALPSPIQDPVAEVAAVVGIDLPDSDEVDEIRTETNDAEDDPEAPGDEVEREPSIDEPGESSNEGDDSDGDNSPDDDDDSSDDDNSSDDSDDDDNSGKDDSSHDSDDDDDPDDDNSGKDDSSHDSDDDDDSDDDNSGKDDSSDDDDDPDDDNSGKDDSSDDDDDPDDSDDDNSGKDDSSHDSDDDDDPDDSDDDAN